MVIVSEYDLDHKSLGAGNHPVSGTRQFGYEINPDGSYNFFVRGVDRLDSNLYYNTILMTTRVDPFLAVDFLWSTFQKNLNKFIKNNDGTSLILPIVKNRVNWDLVKKVLMGKS